MPGAKVFQVGGVAAGSVYAMVKRLADGYYLNDATGAFVSPAPVDPYIALTEDGSMRGVYSLSESRAAWNNGLYRIVFYRQVGGAPAPVTDAPPLAVQDIAVLGDVVMDVWRQAQDATATKTFVLAQRRAQKTNDGSLAALAKQVQIGNSLGNAQEKDQRRQ